MAGRPRIITVKASSSDATAPREVIEALRAVPAFAVIRVSGVQADAAKGVFWQFCDVVLGGE